MPNYSDPKLRWIVRETNKNPQNPAFFRLKFWGKFFPMKPRFNHPGMWSKMSAKSPLRSMRRRK